MTMSQSSILSQMRARAFPPKSFDDELVRMAGGVNNVKSFSEELERDFTDTALVDSPFQSGRKWCCYVRAKVVVFLPLKLVAWAYGDRTITDGNPMLEDPQIVLWLVDGEGIRLRLTAAQAKRSLQQLAKAAPWLPVGYSKVMLETWNNDQASLIETVRRARETGCPVGEALSVELDPAWLKPPSWSRLMRATAVASVLLIVGLLIHFFG